MKWYLKVLKNYVNFNGRAHRTEYWMFTLIDAIIQICFIIALFATLSDSYGSFDEFDSYTGGSGSGTVIDVCYTLYVWGTMLPRLAVLVRRLHDIDKSAWWILIGLIPLIGSIVLFIFAVTAGTHGYNQYGNDPWCDSDDDEQDDEFYSDDEFYEEDVPQQRLRGRSQPAPRSQSSKEDIYDLNESFNRSSDYKNPFNNAPSDDQLKSFDRFGLIDEDAVPTQDRPRRPTGTRNNPSHRGDDR